MRWFHEIFAKNSDIRFRNLSHCGGREGLVRENVLAYFVLKHNVKAIIECFIVVLHLMRSSVLVLFIGICFFNDSVEIAEIYSLFLRKFREINWITLYVVFTNFWQLELRFLDVCDFVGIDLVLKISQISF